MALTSTIVYCEDRDLLDIFPHLSEHDLKKRLYNFGTTTLDGSTYYIVYDAGLVTQLFIDGKSQQSGNQTIGTTAATAINESFTATDTTLTVDSGSALTDATYIKIDSEILGITNISTNDLTVTRGELGTTATAHADDSSIYKHFQPSSPGDNLYDSDNDFLILKYGSDPNNNIVESGDDWSDIKTRFRRKASRLIESHLDNRLSREVLKDREGNYPEIIVHVTALQTVILLLKAHDPNSEVIIPFQEELNEILDGLKAGSIVLPTAISGDSSKGVIREVSVNSSSDLRPIELRGHYNGTGYELLKVYIESGENGIIGTTKMTVKGKDSTLLKTDTLIDSEVITGDFQHLGVGSLYIRWGGDDVTSAITTANDEYEIELWGSSLDSTISSVGSMRMTRR